MFVTIVTPSQRGKRKHKLKYWPPVMKAAALFGQENKTHWAIGREGLLKQTAKEHRTSGKVIHSREIQELPALPWCSCSIPMKGCPGSQPRNQTLLLPPLSPVLRDLFLLPQPSTPPAFPCSASTPNLPSLCTRLSPSSCNYKMNHLTQTSCLNCIFLGFSIYMIQRPKRWVISWRPT